ncbi:MBL fold metallo-hydrolase [Gallaecimonas kandeliae]|uniref:MBL fold metallo-hydrolase n=1 Tax=Gallaecimonas kandeliae TaxID=3029055 RepID=UPI00264715A9|nr:MBL fold metallo-hydrolase [Gallaecimonas kandeliae]WKE64789.1 MBL fold metallo-hydrolase [Gallaecimonas kandeliae]
MRPDVTPFFDEATNSYSYLVRDPASHAAAIIDPVLNFDPAAARISHEGADAIAEMVEAKGLEVQYLLETHVHADHLTASAYLQARLGGHIGIGDQVPVVQRQFAHLFNLGPDVPLDGSQFDCLFHDGERFALGSLEVKVLHSPGHTPACACYLIGDALFVGDTLFMPDYGTARCDFPGGDAATLYDSIHRLYALPGQTRIFLCHDYKAPGRDHFDCRTSIEDQRQHNVHIHQGVDKAAFVGMREARDQTLAVPRLLLPAVQFNLNAGHLPAAEANGVHYLKLPLDQL